MTERGHPLSPIGQRHTSSNQVSLEITSTSFFEEEETHDRAGTLVVVPQRGGRPQQFIIGDGETELDLSLGFKIIRESIE